MPGRQENLPPQPMNIPPWTPHQKKMLREGIRLFNAAQFFDCHEALEEAWLEAAGPQKIFLQGLIQVAVSLHHLRQQNFAGARRLLAAGLEKLSETAPQAAEIDLAALLQALEPLRADLQAGTASKSWPAPRIDSAPVAE
ncbi:MAG: DUF309 domain-containing protein [Acidobacteria bacterium]|nr:DUF309 domain-containing protein [Acidobacteriota bacterium]